MRSVHIFFVHYVHTKYIVLLADFTNAKMWMSSAYMLLGLGLRLLWSSCSVVTVTVTQYTFLPSRQLKV